MQPLGGGGGLDVSLGGKSEGDGSGDGIDGYLGGTFGSPSSIYRNRQRCSAGRRRSTQSALDDRGRDEGEKDGETHFNASSVVGVMISTVGVGIWSSTCSCIYMEECQFGALPSSLRYWSVMRPD